jgi:hypothetical protein
VIVPCVMAIGTLALGSAKPYIHSLARDLDVGVLAVGASARLPEAVDLKAAVLELSSRIK